VQRVCKEPKIEFVCNVDFTKRFVGVDSFVLCFVARLCNYSIQLYKVCFHLITLCFQFIHTHVMLYNFFVM